MGYENSKLSGRVRSIRRQLVTKRWLEVELDSGELVFVEPEYREWINAPNLVEGRRVILHNATQVDTMKYRARIEWGELEAQSVLGRTPIIVIDSNEAVKTETGNLLKTRCVERGWDVSVSPLEAGDYVLSSRVGVELKSTVNDVLASINDGRLWDQIEGLAAYEYPHLIIIGEPYFEGREENFYGSLASLTVPSYAGSLRMPPNLRVIWLPSPHDATIYMMRIAYREQIERKHSLTIRGKWKADTLQEKQERVIASLPSIGLKKARRALRKHGSVEAVISAPEIELATTVGKSSAKQVKTVVKSKYEKQ